MRSEPARTGAPSTWPPPLAGLLVLLIPFAVLAALLRRYKLDEWPQLWPVASTPGSEGTSPQTVPSSSLP